MPVQHDFRRSLAASHAQADHPMWETTYRRAFHNFGSMYSVREDGPAQRGGIDRIVILKNGKTFSIDEKVRYEDYGDIALEHLSDEARGVPGWVAKDLLCDYVAYAVLPRSFCYLLPAQLLREAWAHYGDEWIIRFRRVAAQNRGYLTVSVAVPVQTLMAAIRGAMCISFAEEQDSLF